MIDRLCENPWRILGEVHAFMTPTYIDKDSVNPPEVICRAPRHALTGDARTQNLRPEGRYAKIDVGFA